MHHTVPACLFPPYFRSTLHSSGPSLDRTCCGIGACACRPLALPPSPAPLALTRDDVPEQQVPEGLVVDTEQAEQQRQQHSGVQLRARKEKRGVRRGRGLASRASCLTGRVSCAAQLHLCASCGDRAPTAAMPLPCQPPPAVATSPAVATRTHERTRTHLVPVAEQDEGLHHRAPQRGVQHRVLLLQQRHQLRRKAGRAAGVALADLRAREGTGLVHPGRSCQPAWWPRAQQHQAAAEG